MAGHLTPPSVFHAARNVVIVSYYTDQVLNRYRTCHTFVHAVWCGRGLRPLRSDPGELQRTMRSRCQLTVLLQTLPEKASSDLRSSFGRCSPVNCQSTLVITSGIPLQG